MSVYEALTEQDKSDIEFYIRNYASSQGYYSGSLDLENCSLSYWNSNKEDLFELFGNKLVLETEISYNKSTNQMEADLSETNLTYGPFISKVKEACVEQARKEIETVWSTYPNWYYNIMGCFSTKSLVTNIYSGTKCTFTLKDEKIVMQNGEKVIRILHKIAKILKLEEEYEDFRIQHSMILNQQKFHGTLCLSIHPIDYMTMSDNRYNWSSCMSWIDEGCYREGTLECMNSPYVVVGYIKGSEPFTVSGHSFPNKKWRELFIVHPEMIMGIKGYPFANDDLEKMCVDWLRDLAIRNLGWEFPEAEAQKPSSNDYIWKYGEKCYGRHFDFDFMYNDTFTDRTLHYAHFPKGAKFDKYIGLDSEVRCIICGDYLEEYDCDGGLGTVCCDDCGGAERCSCCGERIRHGDAQYTLGGDSLCEYCWDNHAVWCKVADDYYYDDDLQNVYLVPRDFEPNGYSEFYNYPSTEFPADWLEDSIQIDGILVKQLHKKRFESWPWNTKYFLYEDEVTPDAFIEYWEN